MNFESIGITTSSIYGLTKHPRICRENNCYVWSIYFKGRSTVFFNNISDFKVGNTLREARKYIKQIISNLNLANISEDSVVAVLFEKDGRIRAIGSIGLDCWIDVDDKFVRKTFNELNINITSLKVY